MVNWFRRKWFSLVCVVVAATLLSLSGIQVVDRLGDRVRIGIGDEKVVTLGHIAEAAGAVDYTYDGVDDNVQFQAALNALPATGGRLVDVSAVQKNFSAGVTRAIPNVTITGTGRGSYFVRNGVDPVFTAGGNNWVFQDVRTDVGGITMGATTGWEWRNVTINATYYSLWTERGAIRSDVATGTAPLTVASTTAVTNLNADLWDGKHDYARIVTVGTGGQYATLTAAFAAIVPDTNNRYLLRVYGAITEPGTVVWESFADAEGYNAVINIPATGNGALDFNNITNVRIRGLEVHSTSDAGAVDAALYYRGTTDSTVVIYDSDFYLDAVTSTDAVILGDNTATIRLINVRTFGHAGNVGGVRGLYTGASAGVYILGGEYRAGTGSGTNKIGINIDGVGEVTIIDASFYGSPNGTDIHSVGGYISTVGAGGDGEGNLSNNITITNSNFTGAGTGLKIGRRSKVSVQGGTSRGGGLAGSYGEAWEDNASGTRIGGEIFGNTAAAGVGNAALDISGSASPIITGTVIHKSEFRLEPYGVSVYGTPSPTFNGVTVTPNKHNYIWTYDSANNGRFQPGTPISGSHPYQLVSVNVDVVNANVGVTLDLGTSIAGTQIATGVDIGSTGVKYFAFTKAVAASGGYFYATPSAGIVNGDIKVEFVVVTDYGSGGSGYAWYQNENGGTTRISNSVIQNNFNSDVFRIQSTSVRFLVSNTLIEQWGNSRFLITAAGGITAPMLGVSLIQSYTAPTIITLGSGFLQNINAFIGLSEGTATVLSGNTTVDVTHNLGSTPISNEIQVTPTNSMGNSAKFWLSNIGPATFRVNVDVDPGATTATFAWRIRRGTP